MAGPRVSARSNYSSNTMRRRRQNVMQAAREMIAEHGLDGFTMKQLAARAEVSPATLFNIYGTKENLIGEAVLDAFNSLATDDVSNEPKTFDELLAYIDWVTTAIVGLPDYVPVVTSTYFSRQEDQPVRDLLRNATADPYLSYLKAAIARGQVRDGTNVKMLAEAIAHQTFAHMHDWILGRTTDEDLCNRIELAVMMIIAPALQGEDATRMRAHLDGLVVSVK